MKEWTGIEIRRAEQGIEQASAMVLGRILLAFSQLDIVLGLLLVWSGGGKEVERLTKEVENLSFHKKLDLLQRLVAERYQDEHEYRALYEEWLADAHSTRQLRNDLVHGRWGIDPKNGQVINVIGLPTSPNQREVGYAIADLKRTVGRLEQLQQRLSVLRSEAPL